MAAVDGTSQFDEEGPFPPLEHQAFVRIGLAPTARAIAAGGILNSHLATLEVPYQFSITPTPDLRGPSGEHLVVALGTCTSGDSDVWIAPDRIAEAMTRFESSDSPVFCHAALAFSAGEDRWENGDPVQGVVTDEIPGSLAASTLIHGPFSGDESTLVDSIGSIEKRTSREIRSRIAIACLEQHPTQRSAGAVRRFLEAREVAGPFLTDAGTFDVLDVLAERHAGLACAVVVEQESAIDPARAAWKREAQRIHHAVRNTEAEQIDGMFQLRVEDAPLAPIVRLGGVMAPGDAPVLASDGDRAAILATKTNEPAVAAAVDERLDNLVRHGDGRLHGELTTDIDGIRSAVSEVLG